MLERFHEQCPGLSQTKMKGKAARNAVRYTVLINRNAFIASTRGCSPHSYEITEMHIGFFILRA